MIKRTFVKERQINNIYYIDLLNQRLNKQRIMVPLILSIEWQKSNRLNLCIWEPSFKGIPSYFFLFLKKTVHDPTKNKLYYLIV